MTVQNSKSDRSLNKLATEVAAQKSVQASVESLLIGISQIVKESDFDGDDFERAMDKNNKLLAQSVIRNTPAAVASDTSVGSTTIGDVKDVQEVTDGSGLAVRDPKTTPGAVPNDKDQVPQG